MELSLLDGKWGTIVYCKDSEMAKLKRKKNEKIFT